MQVILEATSGPIKGKIFSFDEPGGFTFGRAPDCTCITENDDTFSRHHFLLEINPPNVTLKDLGSLNGTYVNGVKYGGRPSDVPPEDAEPGIPVSLRDKDRIKAGQYELLLGIDAPALCVDCGREIPPDKRKEAEFIGGTYLCSDCRNADKGRQKAIGRPEKYKAEHPGLDQVKISLDQRKRAENSPAAVIEEIIKQFVMDNEKRDEIPAIQGYKDLNLIGKGGFGAVYKAVRTADNKTVALKTMLQTRRPPKKQLLMFEREKEISTKLRHRNIVHCERLDTWGDIHFIEMEFMDSGSVWDLLKQRRKLNLDESIAIILQVLDGLAYAHNATITIDLKSGPKTIKGVVHRDLKPPNILLSSDPMLVSAPLNTLFKGQLAKISDFGLAKAFAEAGMTKGSVTANVGEFCGSPAYMAPEHIINYRYLKPTTDVFEVAATFYHMLTGSVVWEAKRGVDQLKVILEGEIIPLRSRERGIPKRIANVIDRALSREQDDRYEDAGKMLSAFKKAL